MTTGQRTKASTPPRFSPPGWVRDGLAAFAVLVTAVGPLVRFADGFPLAGYVLAAAPAALMFARRRFPWAVLAACVACFVATSVALVLTPFSALPTGVAIFTLATRTSRRTTLWTVVAVLAVLIPASVLHEWETMHPLTVVVVVMVGFFAAAGDAVRSRRAYIDELTQRAVQAEQTREAEASRRVAEDRLRIARDLHDAVAHQISVINLHTGVALSTLDVDTDAARSAMATAGTAARRVLAEISELLVTLRASDDADTAVPGMSRLSELVSEFESAGLHVTSRVDGDTAALSPAVDVTTYRITQEALTNALKHGTLPRAHVWVTIGQNDVRLLVTNPATAESGAPPKVGHGLVGARERIADVHGTLDVGHDGSTFRFDAVLPLSIDTAEAHP